MDAPYTLREKLFVALAWAWSAAAFTWWCVVFPLQSHGVDYGKHWIAANLLLEGGSPYLGELFLSFNYPLFVGYLYSWLSLFSIKGGEYAWECVHIVYALVGIYLYARYMRPEPAPQYLEQHPQSLETRLRRVLVRHWPTIIVTFLANYQPLHVVLLASNIEPLSFITGTAFTVLFVRRRDRAAGVALACFSLVKFVPVLLLIALIAARRWRVVAGCLATLVLYGFILLVTGLWKTELYLYTDVLPRLGYYWQGISMSFHRFFISAAFPEWATDQHAFSRFVLIFDLLVLAVYVALAGWHMRARRFDGELFLAFGFSTLLLFSPLVEQNHFLWIVGGIFLQLKAWTEGRLHRAVFPFVAVAWGGLICIRFLNQFTAVFELSMKDYWIPAWVILYNAVISGFAAFTQVKR